MNVSLSIINNIDEGQLLKFLKSCGCEYKDKCGMEINYWISNMIEEAHLCPSVINKFFMEEIFYGMHRAINIYKIGGIRRLQNIDLWKEKLFNRFHIEEIPFNYILETHVNKDESEKIAAVDYIENDEGSIEKLRILFVENTAKIYSSGISYTYSYIPVEIDFKKKLMIVKARPRNKIVDGNKPHEFQEKVCENLIREMNIEITPFYVDHQEALYKMSKKILDELFSNIPGYSSIVKLDDDMNSFMNEVMSKITLQNSEEINGNKILNKGIMDMKYELTNMLQKLTVSDYLFNKDEDDIWSTGINTIITCIRFNDSKNATASLSGENRTKHIFNSKAFMDLRNSLEVVKNVRSLSIAYKKSRGSMKVKYDADSEDCLKILVLSYRNYSEEDFDTIWGMYSNNEYKINAEAQKLCTEQVS